VEGVVEVRDVGPLALDEISQCRVRLSAPEALSCRDDSRTDLGVVQIERDDLVPVLLQQTHLGMDALVLTAGFAVVVVNDQDLHGAMLAGALIDRAS
jgi:hypothetical protein